MVIVKARVDLAALGGEERWYFRALGHELDLSDILRKRMTEVWGDEFSLPPEPTAIYHKANQGPNIAGFRTRSEALSYLERELEQPDSLLGEELTLIA